MEIYYAPKVKFYLEDGETGQMKAHTEYALVPAISCSDAETKAMQHYVNNVKAVDVSVISVGPSQISTVIAVKDTDMITEEAE
jgi:hypothetical protein